MAGEVIGYAHDNGQGRTKFVGDIGIKTSFKFIQLFQPAGFQLLLFLDQLALFEFEVGFLLGLLLLPLAIGQTEGENNDLYDGPGFQIKNRKGRRPHPGNDGQDSSYRDRCNTGNDKIPLLIFCFEQWIQQGTT